MELSNVLVLGGAGYIGGKVTDHLRRDVFKPFVPHVYDNLLYEDRFLKPVKFVYGDIRDTEKVYEYIKDKNIETVVLLAALVGDPACNVNQRLTEEINFEAVRKITQRLPKDVHLVFTSTCSVYGANNKLVNEKSKTNPLSSYASTKLRAEKYVLEVGGTVFRLGTVFGIGDTYSRIRTDLVVNTLTVKAFVEGEITINGGNQWRPLISTSDVAGYIVEACERKQSGVFNIAFSNTQIKDLAVDIKTLFPDVKINTIDMTFEDERNYKVLTTKAMKAFEFRPEITPFGEIHKLMKYLESGRIKNPLDINYNNGLYLASGRI